MVDVAEVKIWDKLVGAIRWDNQQQLGYFQYDKEFLKLGWDLSPIKMPLSQGQRIHSFPDLRQNRQNIENTFKGLPGLLSDTLPDKYGNNLINIWLAKQGRQANSMNPVEKLCFIGSRAMGALEFEPTQLKKGTASFALELDSLIGVAKKMLTERENFLTHLDKNEEKAMKDILKIVLARRSLKTSKSKTLTTLYLLMDILRH